MQWNDYKGGAWPQGTTHVQLQDGTVVTADSDHGGSVIRYYGPPMPVEIGPVAPEEFRPLAMLCAQKMMDNELVTIKHLAGYARMGFPLPWKRKDGLEQSYRPIAVLEWIDAQVRRK